MRVLLAGGAGYVGSLVIPHLRREHDLRVIDRRSARTADHVQACVAEEAPLRRALEGMEGLVYMLGAADLRDPEANRTAQVTLLETVLRAAIEAGVRRAVYLSTMSVYGPARERYPEGDGTACVATDPYGASKREGEAVCRALAGSMAVVALRLNNPMEAPAWRRCAARGDFRLQTEASDVARAISLALTRPLEGFHAVNIAGDWRGRRIDCRGARDLLGWEPRARPDLKSRMLAWLRRR